MDFPFFANLQDRWYLQRREWQFSKRNAELSKVFSEPQNRLVSLYFNSAGFGGLYEDESNGLAVHGYRSDGWLCNRL